MKLAFVVQRYGLDIAGGAEYHCRLVAEHMARHAEVEVLTTCAHDYITWANHYPEGVETLGGIPVRRFKVKRPRHPARFAAWSERVFEEAHSQKDELRWLEEEGPFSPRLVRHVVRQQDRYDHFIFFSYRYYPTYHGVNAVPGKALLVPTAEDDGVYRLGLFPPLFHSPQAIVYNSVEERAMIQGCAGNKEVPGDVVGVGSELPQRLDPEGFRQRHGIEGPFLLYVGRVDKNKGCPRMFDFFRRYRRETETSLRLVLIGKSALPIPWDPGIVPLGFLSDQEKWDALAACQLLVMPSEYESLSMVTLEAWWARRPVLANARCAVLRGQCQRSNAGLYFANYDEFAGALALMEANPALRDSLGGNGRRYYEENYSWEVIERKYLALLDTVAASRAVGVGTA